MTLALLVGLPAAMCQPTPVNPVPAVGGLTSTGGASAVGGSGQGGATPGLGGSSGAIGGSSQVETTAVAEVSVFPPCNSASDHAMRSTPKRHALGAKIKMPKQMRAKANPNVTGVSVFWPANDPVALEQSVGSCTGEAADHVASNQPYKRHSSRTDAEACYSAATKIDNGCAWNAKTCEGSWPPNDVGSWATSAYQAATSMGWFKGTRPVTQTLQGWHDALLKGPCSFDQNWYNDGFEPNVCGFVNLTGGLAGGHSTAAVGWNMEEGYMVLRNSWGPWGLKGGYYRYSTTSLVKLLAGGAVMVCPSLP